MNTDLFKWLQPQNQFSFFEETLDGQIEELLPLIQPNSKSLSDSIDYLNFSWVEIRDELNFHNRVLHIFNREGGNYIRSTDGNSEEGKWRFLDVEKQKLSISLPESNELFNLVFLDEDFFILTKPSNPMGFKKPRYLVMVKEKFAKEGIEWHHVTEVLYNKYEEKTSFSPLIVGFILVLVIIIILFSLL